MRHLRRLSMSAVCLVASLGFTPARLHASVHENAAFGCRLAAPDSWQVRSSLDGSLLRFTSDGDEGVTVGFKFRYVSEPLDGQQLVRFFKGHGERLEGLTRGLRVATRPSRARVGVLPGYAYAFQYRTFVDEEEEERRYFLTTPSPRGAGFLLVAAAVKGLRRTLDEQRWAVDALLSSFVVDARAPGPSSFGPSDDVTCLDQRALGAGDAPPTGSSVPDEEALVAAMLDPCPPPSSVPTDGVATSQFDLFSRTKRAP